MEFHRTEYMDDDGERGYQPRELSIRHFGGMRIRHFGGMRIRHFGGMRMPPSTRIDSAFM